MDDTYKVILAEDHQPFRSAIKKLLQEIPGVEVVAETGEGRELFELLESTQPELLLLDIAMPNLKAMEATPEIKSQYSHVKIIIMLMDQDTEYLTRAVSAGADGVLLKQDSGMNLPLAIQEMRLGKQYFPGQSRGKSYGTDTMPSSIFAGLTWSPIC